MSGYSQASQPHFGYPYGVPVTAQHHPTQYHQHTMPLPNMSTIHPSSAGPQYGSSGPHVADASGQIAPNNHKPKLTGTVWEDEGTVCFQVEVNGICVARREDNCFINGTKLLNVANMTRGRRDGILKSEKTRTVIKVGPMHLKGVWIPYDRALEFANKENITEQLYPLFLHNIGMLLAPHFNPNSTAAAGTMSARRSDGSQQSPVSMRTPQTQPITLPSANQQHHAMATPVSSHMPQTPHSIAPYPASGRPGLERAHTFPTPPASASNLMGLGHSDGPYDWNPQGTSAPVSQGLHVETGLGLPKSTPTTPTTTSPGQALPRSFQTSQAYDNPRPVYAAPLQHSHYNMGSQPNGHYSSMQPPVVKAQPDAKEDEADLNGHAYNPDRAYHAYAEPTRTSSDVKDSAIISQNGSGRATPRSMATPHTYNTPQRTLPSSSLTYLPNDGRNAMTSNGRTTITPNGYSNGTTINGTPANLKRGREIEDDQVASIDNTVLKRRKVFSRDDMGTQHPRAAVAQRQ